MPMSRHLNSLSLGLALCGAPGAALTSAPCVAATLTVGPGQQYATIAAAIAASSDGDTVAVQAGTYTNDFAEIGTQISLVAMGGRVTMRATEDLPNGKGILITDTNISITGFSFIGGKIPNNQGGNGAGIRYQGGNLTLTDCYFAHNQDGLLGAPDPNGSIVVQASEFAFNGNPHGPNAGYAHNIYAGAVALLDIENSWFHNAYVGHEIKSRALATTINNTRITDGPTGTASYSIDMPNGGVATITNDQIEKGPAASNQTIIAYGEEGGLAAGSSITISNTLIENDLMHWSPTGLWNQAGVTASLAGLSIYNLPPAQVYTGAATVNGISYLATEPVISTKHPWQVK
jgi:hypothetical protein